MSFVMFPVPDTSHLYVNMLQCLHPTFELYPRSLKIKRATSLHMKIECLHPSKSFPYLTLQRNSGACQSKRLVRRAFFREGITAPKPIAMSRWTNHAGIFEARPNLVIDEAISAMRTQQSYTPCIKGFAPCAWLKIVFSDDLALLVCCSGPGHC